MGCSGARTLLSWFRTWLGAGNGGALRLGPATAVTAPVLAPAWGRPRTSIPERLRGGETAVSMAGIMDIISGGLSVVNTR